MTLEDLSRKMTNQEFELRMALEMVKQDECPNCGIEPRDMGEYGVTTITCPTCKQPYSRLKYWGSTMKDDPPEIMED